MLQAGTSGAAFASECEALYASERHGEVLDKFVSQLELVLAKAGSDQGGCLVLIGGIGGRASLPGSTCKAWVMGDGSRAGLPSQRESGRAAASPYPPHPSPPPSQTWSAA